MSHRGPETAKRQRYAGLAVGAVVFASAAAAVPLAWTVASHEVAETAAQPSTISAETRTRLTYLVRQDCGSCHGMTLKGGLGRPLLPETLAHWDEESVASVILDGIPQTPMPPWRGLLDESEARWIAHALKQGKI